MTITDAHQEFLDFVRSDLRGKGGHYTNWIRIDGRRICAECQKHKGSALYIHLEEGVHPFLKCFRISCDIRRYMRYDDFINLGYSNIDAIKLLISQDKLDGTKEISLSDEVPLIITDSEFTFNQIAYFRKRTNLNLTDSVATKFRVIPNLYDTIHETFIDDTETLSKFSETKILSHKNAITFTDHDNAMFYYRSVNSDVKLKFNTGVSYGYTLINGTPDTIVIAEGIFDIINIYNYYAVMDSAIYIASGGTDSILNDILYYYSKYIDTITRLIIFADSDIKLENKRIYNKKFYKSIISRLDNKIGSSAFSEIYIVYNSKGKDFGDMSDDIYPVKEKIR